MPGVARIGADTTPASQNCHQAGLGRQCVTARGRPMMPLPRGRRSSLSDPLSSQVPGSSTATVTAGDAVVSGKVDPGTVHLKVASEQRFEVRPPAPQERQQHSDGSPRGHVLWWKSPAILQRQEMRVAPVQRCWSTPTLSEATHHPPALILDVIQAQCPAGQVHTDFPLSSLMHRATAKTTWLQESHNVRVNFQHLGCGLAGSVHRHTLSRTYGNGAILLRDEASIVNS